MPCLPLPKMTHKVELFPGKHMDWRGLLALIMEDLTIKSVAIVTQHHGDEYSARWSGQKLEDLAFKGRILDMAAEVEVATLLEPTFIDDDPDMT
jgi:hypothetical protein